ncbi:hypothetical protein ACJMK2_018207 [Sinanodonta woodiana]|uniref:Receptor for retinol uptake STRA6 n=1 Tax=Sinanodonta woodiana TaxID=1069815 RepID=A0ABD3UFS0_SINWO
MEGNDTDDLNDFSADKILGYFYEAFNSDSQEPEEDDVCTSSIRHDLFHLYLLIPSLLLRNTITMDYSELISLHSTSGIISDCVYYVTFEGLWPVSYLKDMTCVPYIEIVLEFIRVLPLLLCQLYLSISLPVRIVQSIRERKEFFSSMQRITVLELEKSIHDSWEGKHVAKIFRPPRPEPVPPETRKGKIMAHINKLRKFLLYNRQTDFRYSAQLLSVMLVGGMIIYRVTFEIIYHVDSIYKILGTISTILETIGFDEEEGEIPLITTIRKYIYLLYYIFIALHVTFINKFYFRTNLQNLYKGTTSHIPPRTGKSNPSMLVGSMKYAGYQVGYIAWGFFIQFLVYLLISVQLAVIIAFIRAGFYKWLVDILMQAWPVLLTAFVLHYVQTMLAKFVFLQENGNTIRINNRRLMFNFTYFLFFYNILIGLISCLMRITNSLIFWSMFISRLDKSVLPQRFQTLDPGFNAYVGFMHIEMAHTHPVVIVFLRLLAVDVGIQKETRRPSKSSATDALELTETVQKKRKKFMRARNNWQTMYTLINNPSISQYRKHHIAL